MTIETFAIVVSCVALLLVGVVIWLRWELAHAIDTDEYGFPLDWYDGIAAPADRQVALAAAIERVAEAISEDCFECRGTLGVHTGVEHGGQREIVGCPECYGLAEVAARAALDVHRPSEHGGERR